ncbi:MAG: hypothetical protein ACOYI4_00495 [Christensenellales bacterium]|jgi:hypothetical protein
MSKKGRLGTPYRRSKPKNMFQPKRRSSVGMAVLRILGGIVVTVGVLALFALVILPALNGTGVFAPTESFSLNQPLHSPNGLQTPQPTDNLQKNVSEVVLRNRNVFSPSFYGDEMIFSAGNDAAGNAKMNWIYLYDTVIRAEEERVEGIILENDDLMEPQFNEDYIVYLDAKRSGGAELCAYDRRTGETNRIKTIPASLPKIRFCDNMIAWVERTGTNQDKLYLYDLEQKLAVTAAVFNGSIYGSSAPGLCEGKLIWADQSLSVTEGGAEQSVIMSLDIRSETGQLKAYTPGMFVHNPMTNGDETIWGGEHAGSGCALYASVNDGPPRKIDDNVSQYGIGDGFAAYCKGGVLYTYSFENAVVSRLSPHGELCSLSSVDGKRVVWMNVVEKQAGEEVNLVDDRDIVKYADVEG